MAVLLTGGAGYIGSHTALALMAEGMEVVILDNLSNSSPKMLPRIAELGGCEPVFYEGDVRDRVLLREIFRWHRVECVIHFAGLKAVGESVRRPLAYYDNNVSGSLILLEEMAAAGVLDIVFSSSATVYGLPESVPIGEEAPTGNTGNPYGTSKYMVERILADLCAADGRWTAVVLRYFNPVGAHGSGRIGENPRGIPNNLLPYVCQVASGKLARLAVFGSDYPTADGTGVRDYIHVCDLADGHVQAMRVHRGGGGLHIYNLGTGRGYSVLEVVRAFERVNGVAVPYCLEGRRPGDVAVCYADPSKARRCLGWQVKYGLEEMMRDAWRWQRSQPEGLF